MNKCKDCEHFYECDNMGYYKQCEEMSSVPEDAKNNLLTKSEMALLDRITLLAVYNGNHIDQKAFEPTPEEYGMIFDIRKKLNLNK